MDLSATQLIIFDWDDVITLGSKDGYIACYHAAIEAVGVHLDPAEEQRRIESRWSQSHVQELGALLGDDDPRIDRVGEIYLDQLFGDTFVRHLRLVPGVVETLTALERRYRLAVATGAHPKLVQQVVMPRFGIDRSLFCQFESGYDVPSPDLQKPNPYMLKKILAEQAAPAEHALYVGDAETDVRFARNAAVEPVVVLTGQLSYKEATELGVTHMLKDVTDLPKLLEQI